MRLLINLMLIIFIFIMFGTFIYLYQYNQDPTPADENIMATLRPQTYPVVMYSTLDCTACDKKKMQFIEHHIDYTERVMGIDDKAPALLDVLIIENNYEGDVIAPIFDINGHMLTGNPSIKELSEYW